jgi:hypothetical protein
VSQKPSLEHTVSAVEVQMSKIRATAPPWREPATKGEAEVNKIY